VATYIFGHTHRAASKFHANGALANIAIANTGAFQRVISAESLEKLRVARSLSPDEVLKLKPEDLPACYTFVRLAQAADPETRRWLLVDGKWKSKLGPCP
jgi:hypothetical protein